MAKDADIKVNWLAVWLTVIFLIVIGWCLGLIVNPPVAEVIFCPRSDMIEIVDRLEEGDVAVLCKDYSE